MRPTYYEIWPESVVMWLTGGSTAGYTTDKTGTVWGPGLWTDETQPRTDSPLMFVRRRVGVVECRSTVSRYFRASSGRLF